MSKNKKELPIPPFFDKANASSWEYSPDQLALQAAAIGWRDANNIKASGTDRANIQMLIIDAQKDFCFAPPKGALYVGGQSGTGAVDDNVRMAEFIYRNLNKITGITTTLDTHFAFQIFFPSFWLDENGKTPAAMTMISGNDIRAGKYRPNPAVATIVCEGNYNWLLKQVEFYCDELERKKKYQLTLWPPHCVLGSDGHALAGVIHEARLFHDFARGAQSRCEVKGGHPLTENYSVFRPEVLARWDGKPLAQKNTRFLQMLLNSDAVIIAGQAKSHCVAWTIADLLDEIRVQDEELAKKVYLLEDCASAVVIPGIVDFTDEANKAFKNFADAGMNIVKSTDRIEDYPGIKL